jgi:hypothetical protein
MDEILLDAEPDTTPLPEPETTEPETTEE